MSELQTTTVTLSQALKSSSVRGRGAVAVVELAGMERRVAFDEQVSGDSGRPDMVVYLPGGGEVAGGCENAYDSISERRRSW